MSPSSSTTPDRRRTGPSTATTRAACASRRSRRSHPTNVGALRVAWSYRHGDVSDGSDGTTRTSFNATPIVVDDALYFCTGLNRVIALEPETGRELWTFDPKTALRKLEGPYRAPVAAWRTGRATAAARTRACATRIFTGTIDSELIALDAQTGRAVRGLRRARPRGAARGLGDAAAVGVLHDLAAARRRRRGRGRRARLRQPAHRRAERRGARVRRAPARCAGPGIRCRRGRSPPESATDAGPLPARHRERVVDPVGGPGARARVRADRQRARPTTTPRAPAGSTTTRARCVALRADTGALAWHFQTVHHDVWDYDVPAQPVLLRASAARTGRCRRSRR